MGVGIVGGGVSALHLGLLLRANEVPVTVYAEQSGEQIASGRLQNTVAHHHLTLAREAELGLDHWPAAEYGYRGHTHWFADGGPPPFRGEFSAPSRAVDYRIYLPQLMADFAERGGDLRVGPVDLEIASLDHDLTVVAAGRGPVAEVFGVRPDRHRTEPFRRLTAALYRGIAPADPLDVVLSVTPGVGEVIEIPILTFDGMATAVLIEGVPGGDLAAAAEFDREDLPGFAKQVLDLLARYAPLVHERVDANAFAVNGPLDVLQGAIAQRMREDWVRLDNGRPVLAVGDAHCLLDPVVAQGANAASYSAWVVGHAILEGGPFDEAFCAKVAERRREFLESAYDWVESMLLPPSPQMIATTVAMVANKGVCDTFTDNFAHPDRQWASLRSMDAARTHLAGYGMDADALLAMAGPPPS
ncbi:MAG: styrene monooxygenase/indole monooxygenase family protein [Sporichthyaceae bacterium]